MEPLPQFISLCKCRETGSSGPTGLPEGMAAPAHPATMATTDACQINNYRVISETFMFSGHCSKHYRENIRLGEYFYKNL